MTTFEKLKDILAEQFVAKAKYIHPETPLADFGADSLDNMELTLLIDDEFGIDLPDGALMECETVSDLAAKIDHLTTDQKQ